jgi:hypothetical protein
MYPDSMVSAAVYRASAPMGRTAAMLTLAAAAAATATTPYTAAAAAVASSVTKIKNC